MKKTRILIVDDYPFARSGVVQWINQQRGLVCCGEADGVQSTREAIEKLQPDLVMLEIKLKDGDGLDLTREILATHPAARILVLSQHDEDTYAHRALRAGARGYVMKSEAFETVLNAIETIQRGDVYVSRPMAAKLLHNLFPDPQSPTPELATLSDRELQVFQLLGAGLATRAIADRLHISRKTVETYREHLKEKLHIPSSHDLAVTAQHWVQSGHLSV